METFEATVTSKGQITLPVRLRQELGLKPGDRLVFRRDAQGMVQVEARTDDLATLKGIVKAAASPVDGNRIAAWIEDSRGGRWRQSGA